MRIHFRALRARAGGTVLLGGLPLPVLTLGFGALLMASAQPKDETLFFRALLIYAVTMIGIVPLVVWLVFVRSGLF